MRKLALFAVLMALSAPVWAEDFPQGPKAPPPEPLPEPICDIAKPSSGDWLLGRWVAPYSRWEFTRPATGPLAWALEQKADINRGLGWKQGASFGGEIAAISGCTVRLEAKEKGEVVFAFEGVLTADGKVYGFAVNPAGQQARWILRRER